MKKMITVVLAAAAMSLAMASAAFAGPGQWMSNDYGMWWQRDDGSYPVARWSWIDGDADSAAECYHFDNQGYLDMDTWVDGYYVNRDGAWEVNGMVQTHTFTEGFDEWASVGVDYERTDAVNNSLLGRYEMHTEMVDCYITIENWQDGMTYLIYSQNGYHEDGSLANAYYTFQLQEIGGGHYVGDEYQYSGDMISFDWYQGQGYLDHVVLNGMDMTRFYRVA